MSDKLNIGRLFAEQLRADVPEPEPPVEDNIYVDELIRKTIIEIEDIQNRREKLIEQSNQLMKEIINEAKSSQPTFGQQVIELFNQRNSRFSDPETFTSGIQSLLQYGIHEKIGEKFPDLQPEQRAKMAFLFTHYLFVTQTVGEVIRKKVDTDQYSTLAKSIVKAYASFITNGKVPDENETTLPFGSLQQWTNLCDSLQELYEGKPDGYIQQMIELTS